MNPVFNCNIFCFVESPNITFFNFVAHQDITILIFNFHNTIFSTAESKWMASILFSFFRHKTNIADMSHCCNIKLTILFTIFKHCAVHCCIASIRNNSNTLLKFALFVPHFSAFTDNWRHRSIDNNVIREMKVCDTFIAVNHCDIWITFFNNSF